MLKNPNVERVRLNSETGECMIFMQNGERYRAEEIYYPEDLLNYVSMLDDEDGLVFDVDTSWILIMKDWMEGWDKIFEKITPGKILKIPYVEPFIPGLMRGAKLT